MLGCQCKTLPNIRSTTAAMLYARNGTTRIPRNKQKYARMSLDLRIVECLGP